MVTDPGLLHVEGKRFLETKAHHRFSLIAFGGQRFEIQKHYADSRVRQHGNHIAPAIRNAGQRVLNHPANRIALPQIILDQVGNHNAR